MRVNQSSEKTLFSVFSAFTSFFKNKKKNDLLHKSKKLLNEYIDLERIIQKLQDIDKLKAVLFSDSQRFYFDQIPKPFIIDEPGENIGIGKVKILKKNIQLMTNQQITKESEKFLDKFNEIDERIMSLLEPKTLKKLDLQQTDSSYLNN